MTASAPRADRVIITPGTSLGRESPTPPMLTPPRANVSSLMRLLPDFPFAPSRPAPRAPSRSTWSAFTNSRACALLGGGPCERKVVLMFAAQILVYFLKVYFKKSVSCDFSRSVGTQLCNLLDVFFLHIWYLPVQSSCVSLWAESFE